MAMSTPGQDVLDLWKQIGELVPDPDPSAGLEPLRKASQEATDANFREADVTLAEIGSTSRHVVPVAGGEITVAVYTPAGPGPHPGLLYMHGGGWMLGSIDWMASIAQGHAVAAQAGCVYVDVEYRLAPENPFPIPLEDTYAALVWLHENAAELGVDPDRIAVGGESAGGGLAASVCLLARERGGPQIAAQLLCTPATDIANVENYESVAEFAAGFDDQTVGPGLASLRHIYCGDPEIASSPLVSPMLAEDLSGLPPAHVITIEHDMVRDLGTRYAERLVEAGVPTTTNHLTGMVHAVSVMLPGWEGTPRWYTALADGLNAALASESASAT